MHFILSCFQRNTFAMDIQSLLLIFVIFVYKTDAGVYECNNDVDCIDPAAKCKDSICECPQGTEYNLEGTKCMKLTSVYGGPCEEDVQCSPLTGLAKCKDGACICGDEYIYLKGKCHRKKAFGDACTKDEECFLGGFYNANKCEQNACTCASGFYIRNNTDCMPEGKAIGDLCLIDGDCKIPKSFCNVGRCEVENSSPPKILKPSINYSKRRNVEESKSSIKIKPHITIIRNIKCKTNQECEQKQNTYCSAIIGECVCLKGYFLKGDRCIPELGTECSSDEDCEIKNSACTSGKCVCKTEPFLYVMNNGNTECIKPAVAPYFYCMEDASCKTFSSNYECFDSPDQRTCKCKSGYSPNEYNICQIYNTGSGGLCLKDDDCSTFSPNSVCSSTKYCVCKENYSFIDNVCQANVGAPCAAATDCVVPNSSCTNAQKCSCDIGFAPVTPTECRKVSEGLGNSCEYHLECSQKVSGSECKDGLCSCTDGFIKINNGCYKIAEKMGDYCVLPQSCTVSLGSNVQCRNSQCQCGVGMKPTEDGSDCVSKGVITKGTSFLFVAIVALLFS